LYFTPYDGVNHWPAFLDLCALLAPRAIASEPLHDWDWKLIVRLASDHMVAPAVWRSIKGRGFVANEAKVHFHLVHKKNAERNAVIFDALTEAVSRLQEIGIKPILLKGAASLASGLYADPSERILTDVDLLVSSRQIGAAKVALCGMGYTVYSPPDLPPPRWARPRKHHIDPLIHPSGIFSIEIHSSSVALEFEQILPTDDILDRSVAIQWNGRPVFTLHPTDQLIHNIVHSQLQDGRFSRGIVELRQMREFALLAARHGDVVDWRDVEHRFSSTGYANVLAQQAALCLALMGVPLPVAAADIHHSMIRLRHGVDPPPATAVTDDQHSMEPLRRGLHPSAAAVLTTLARDYVAGFLRDPQLALNLFNPFWWPQRIRGIRRALQRNDALGCRFGPPRGVHRRRRALRRYLNLHH
jgi:hypothetical protein